MVETGFIGAHGALLFFVYGLIFFSIGISILIQPRREKPASKGPDFWLLGAFGVLHGASEWLSLPRIIGTPDVAWEGLRLAVTGLSFLGLFEFGRRLVAEAANYVHSPTAAAVARPRIAYLLPAVGGAVLVLNEPGRAEVEACIRYTLAFPGAVLAGAGFLHYASVCEVAVNHRSARRGLHLAGIAFFAYAIAAGLAVGPSAIPASQYFNASKFVASTQIPIEFVRAVIGAVLLVGMARVIHTFNTAAFDRLAEARDEVHSLKQRSEMILELVDDGVCGIDEMGRITFANAAAKRMLGYDDDALLGLPYDTLRCCDPFEQTRNGPDAPFSCPRFPHPDHHRSERESLVRRDGTCFPVEYTSAPKYAGDRLTGAVLAFRDISARRRHEAAERWEQEERFGALFEQAAVGIAVVALDGQCLRVNARLSRLLGYPQSRMVEADFSDFIHPDERAQCVLLKAQLVDGHKHVSPLIEGRCIRHDGSSVWVQFSFAIVRDCDDRPMYCFLAVEDISVRKQAERMRQHYQEQLEQRVEARTRALARSNHELESANQELEAFSYSVSHDLRSPLRAINGFTHALAEDCGHLLDDLGLQYLERTQNATVRMGELIDGLLNLSRVFRSELAVTTVDLSQLAGELAEQLQQGHPDRAVSVQIEPGLKADGDTTLLRLLLQNLLDNAWKFTAAREQPSIAFGRTVCEGLETYFVSDNGIGFESEYAHKLFQPFERLHGDAEYKGMGIGLATVRRIVQRHNGIAWAEGEVGQGATFYFTLSSEGAREQTPPAAVAVGL